MKKIIAITLAAALCASFAACSGKPDNTNNNAEPTTVIGTEENVQVVNPIRDTSLDEAAAELGLKRISFVEGAERQDTVRIEGETEPLYSFEIKVDGVLYNIRIAKNSYSDDADISGVNLSSSDEYAIFDSADADAAPSVTVGMDNNYTVAYAEWNGYYMSITAEGKIENMQPLFVEFAKLIIAKENIETVSEDTDNESASCVVTEAAE